MARPQGSSKLLKLQPPPLVDEVVVAADVIAATGDALLRTGGRGLPFRIGVLGIDALPAVCQEAIDNDLGYVRACLKRGPAACELIPELGISADARVQPSHVSPPPS
jgi:hypothetical protein